MTDIERLKQCILSRKEDAENTKIDDSDFTRGFGDGKIQAYEIVLNLINYIEAGKL